MPAITSPPYASSVGVFFVGELLLSRLLFQARVVMNRIQPRRKWCKVISGGQLRRTGTTLEPAPTEV
jgi:hypothetical protein